jgi:hypothetical protein
MMRKMIRKMVNSKKIAHYCVDVLKTYNMGRVNLPA